MMTYGVNSFEEGPTLRSLSVTRRSPGSSDTPNSMGFQLSICCPFSGKHLAVATTSAILI